MTAFDMPFRAVSEWGLPLVYVLDHTRGQVDLRRFVLDARKAGWKCDKAVAVIREALFEFGETRDRIDLACELARYHWSRS